MPQSLTLRFLSGPRAGQTLAVPAAGLLIGRKAGNDLVLEDPSVSGRHALLRPEGAGLMVEDLGSTNGTRIDGQRIERQVLLLGQRLRLGNVELELQEESAAGAPAEVPAARAPAPAVAPPPAPAPPTTVSPGGLWIEEEIVLSSEAPVLPARSLPAAAARPTPSPAARPAGADPAATTRAPAAAKAPRASSAVPRAPEAPPSGAVSSGPESAGLKQLDLSRLKSGRGPLVAAGLLLAGLAGTVAWLLLGSKPEGGEDSAERGPPAIAGNLLGPDWSFELPEGQSSFSDNQEAPLRFTRGRSFALSGARGLGLDALLPEPPQASGRIDVVWAGLSSAAQTVTPGDWMQAAIALRGAAGASAALGLLFESSRADRAPFEMTVCVGAGENGQQLSLALPVLSGYDRCYARLFASPATAGASADSAEDGASRELALDDFVLREVEAAGSQKVGDFSVIAAGALAGLDPEGGAAAADRELLLVRQERPLMQLAVLSDARPQAAQLGLSRQAVQGPAQPERLRVVPASGGILELWLEPLLLERSERALASVAGSSAAAAASSAGESAPSAGAKPSATGTAALLANEDSGLLQAYQSHGDQFEREGVLQLLIGRDLDLIRLGFEAPVQVSARPMGERVRLLISAAGDLPAFELQLVFGEQRAAAAVEAAAARRAEADGKLGETWLRYTRLLESAPFERQLVAEAELVIGRLSSDGLTELEAIERQLERAAFFGLEGLYAECSQRAQMLATKHSAFEGRPGPIAAAAAALMARISAESKELTRPRDEADGLSAPALRAALRSGPGAPLAEILERLARANAFPR